MKISNFRDIRELISKFKNEGGRDFLQQVRSEFRSRRGDESEEGGFIPRNERARAALEAARERRRARRAARQGGGAEEAQTEPTATEPTATETNNTNNTQEAATENSTTPISNAGETLNIDQLAELYVQQYEQGSGVELSEEAFQQKKAEVASFYSDLSNGRERLDQVVFANDTETVA